MRSLAYFHGSLCVCVCVVESFIFYKAQIIGVDVARDEGRISFYC